MISAETIMLMKLESARLRMVFLVLLFGLLLLAIIGQVHFADLYAGFHFVLPFVAGILFSAGMIADDLQQRTWSGIGSLPVSRKRLWTIRLIYRLTLYLSFLAFWLIIPIYFPMHTKWSMIIDWNTSETSPWILILSGFMAFATGLFFTVFMRNAFETAIATAAGTLLLNLAVRWGCHQWSLVVLSIIAIITVGVAARNLFLCREPLEITALIYRAAAWMVFLAVIIIPFSLIF